MYFLDASCIVRNMNNTISSLRLRFPQMLGQMGGPRARCPPPKGGTPGVHVSGSVRCPKAQSHTIAGGSDACVVHAPGRALHAGVSRCAQTVFADRDL